MRKVWGTKMQIHEEGNAKTALGFGLGTNIVLGNDNLLKLVN